MHIVLFTYFSFTEIPNFLISSICFSKSLHGLFQYVVKCAIMKSFLRFSISFVSIFNIHLANGVFLNSSGPYIIVHSFCRTHFF